MLSEEKKNKKLLNTNVIIRHNAIVVSCVDVGANLMFLFKEGLALISRRLSSIPIGVFLFFMVNTLKFSKDGEWFQSNK